MAALYSIGVFDGNNNIAEDWPPQRKEGGKCTLLSVYYIRNSLQKRIKIATT